VLERSKPTGFFLSSTVPTSVRAQPPETMSINFIAKEIWLSFDFVTCRGMVKEKALVDSGTNENCIDIKTTEKLGVKPRLLPQVMGLRNVDRTNNCGGLGEINECVAWETSARASRMRGKNEAREEGKGSTTR
jgi:hypothetical protein